MEIWLFTFTYFNRSKALVNNNMVDKVINYSNCRAIYQGSDTNNFQVKESLSYISGHLK